MMTYLIEIATPEMGFWVLEKVRANSLAEAQSELKATYGDNAFFGYGKAVY